jgi:hypothetical protein
VSDTRWGRVNGFIYAVFASLEHRSHTVWNVGKYIVFYLFNGPARAVNRACGDMTWFSCRALEWGLEVSRPLLLGSDGLLTVVLASEVRSVGPLQEQATGLRVLDSFLFFSFLFFFFLNRMEKSFNTRESIRCRGL